MQRQKPPQKRIAFWRPTQQSCHMGTCGLIWEPGASAPEGGRLPAFLTPAMPPQIIPGINSAGMPIVPVKAESIPPHRRDGIRPRRSLVHRQQCLRMRLCLTWLAPRLLPFLMACCAGACIPKPGKSPLAPVSIFPVDLQARPLGLVHADFRRRLRIRRKLPLLHPRPARLFLADKPDSFVTHLSQCIVRPSHNCGCLMSRV